MSLSPGPAGSSPPLWRSAALLYCLLLLATSIALFLGWPIFAGDTDLWFHLSDGQYLFQHRAIPTSSFFSFITPPVSYVRHPWLFDALTYLLFSRTGYGGLIILRALLYGATLLVVFRCLLASPSRRVSPGWAAFLVASICLMLIPRCLLVRPHLFTYLFIVVFLYILECHPKAVRVLPMLAVAWCNIHGMTYPVLLLICGAYAVEYLIKRSRHQPDTLREWPFFFPLILSMAAVFMTPHHVHLLPLPFQALAYSASFTQELMPFSFGAMSSFGISGLIPSYQTVFNVLFAISGVTLLQLLLTKRLRVSHGLLWLGGIVLLVRANRFMYEFMLLALPLLASSPLVTHDHLSRILMKPVRILLAMVLMIMPLLFLRTVFANRMAYPFSVRALPQGVATFLKNANVTADVLNHPNSGGYLRWMLYPQYRIFMDMEDFQATSFHMALNACRDQETLRKVLVQYHPGFLSVPISFVEFEELIRPFPEYRIVFFDDVEVLYADTTRYPQVGPPVALGQLHPFQLMGADSEAVLADGPEREQLLKQLGWMLDIYPFSGMANQLVALAYHQDGAYDIALDHAQVLMRVYPEAPTGYDIAADAYRGLGLMKPAIAHYRRALRRASAIERSEFGKKLGMALLADHQYRDAYHTLKHAVDVSSSRTSLEDAYQFGTAARLSGHRKVAEAVFVFLYTYRIAPENVIWANKLKAELTRLGVDLDQDQHPHTPHNVPVSRETHGL